MSATDSTLWFWSDWRADLGVRDLTLEERGLWIDLLAMMADGVPHGYLTDAQGRARTSEAIAGFARCHPDEVDHLIKGIMAKGVASVDSDGRLYNRRMARMALANSKKVLASHKKREAGKKGSFARWHGHSKTMAQATDNAIKPDFAISNALTNADGKCHGKTIAQRRASFPIAIKSPEETQSKTPGGSLATALPAGALASPPEAVPEGGQKPVHELTAAEAIERRRRKKGA